MKLKDLVYLSLIALVVSLRPAIHAQTFSLIHTFNYAEGASPHAGVTLRGSVLYGTTYDGGDGAGTIYQMKRQGSNWITNAIYLFDYDVGGRPQARVVFGPDFRLYGTALQGGAFNDGAVFYLLPPLSVCKTANCSWKATEIHGFLGNGNDGIRPGYGDLVWDQQRNIYGTTFLGGNSTYGTVFQITPSGNTWTETPIYNFKGFPDGEKPYGGLAMDGNGNLFGTTEAGGASVQGVVFKLTNVVGVGWQETILYTFPNSGDGRYPVAGLIIDKSGNLYGATADGGVGGGGTVFELTLSGDTYTYNLLYSFSGQPGLICGPQANLTMDAAGNLYGTTRCDGANNVGNIFKLTNTVNGWSYTSLHDFTGEDGEFPYSNVTIDPDGVTLYGTASEGIQNNGVVWMIKP